jgi:hypothetical protein
MTTPTSPDRITPSELRLAFQSLNERLDLIETDLTTLRDGLVAAANQPAATPAAGNVITFDASILLVGVDDYGAPSYKLKGSQYMKFGVRVWPETLPALGIDPAALKPGPNPVNLRVRALMGDKGPRKVIGKI